MYWVVYPDGELSFDFYNYSRAHDHCRAMEETGAEQRRSKIEG